MAVIGSANVTAGVPLNGIATLTFTDTSASIGTLLSRTLIVNDYLSNLLFSASMGASRTAFFNVTADGYYSFIETIIDNTGTYTVPVNICTTSFYQQAFVNAMVALQNQNTDLYGTMVNISNAQNNRYGSQDAALFSQPVISQNLITYANFLINNPYYVNQ